MKPETLLYDLREFGENYAKASPFEQEQYMLDILDIITELVNNDPKFTLNMARNTIRCFRVEESRCPNCGQPLKFEIISTDRLEAWGRPVEMEEVRVAKCSDCGWEV